jgi:flagellar biosynthesis/type III secretory pathway protein FliH
MSTLADDRRRDARVLFEEDFDLPPRPSNQEPPPEPEVIEPLFSAAELDNARAEGWQEGHDQALAAADVAGETMAREALAAIAAQLTQSAAEARAIADAGADAIAQLLLAGFAAAFPTLCQRYGEAEICAVVRTILPVLQSEPKITVRVSPGAVPAVTRELGTLDPEFSAQVQVLAADALSAGDVRIAWRAGNASRDTKRLWQDIEAILAPAGLLPPQAAPPQAAPLQAAPLQAEKKETADVD